MAGLGAFAPSDRPPPRVDGTGCRSPLWACELLPPDRRPQHPDRSGLVGARLAVQLRRAEARQRSRASPSTALPPIDVVLVVACHYDHLDVETLSRLQAAHRPRVVTPLGNDTIMRAHDAAIAAEAFDWHQRVELGNGVAVTLVPTQHWSARGADRPQHGAVGLVRDRDAGGPHLLRGGFQATATASISARRATATARSGSRCCRSAPTSRAGSWRDQHMNPAEVRARRSRPAAPSGARPSLRHVPAHRRGDRCAGRL